MNGLELLFALDSEPLALRTAALSLLLAFGLTQVLGAIYVWTFRGMSYSQGLVHAIVLGSIIACMLMLAIGNSIAAGLGIAGGLAIVRFRTALRDPRDMIFVFAGLGTGIAMMSSVGSPSVSTSIVWPARVTLPSPWSTVAGRRSSITRSQLSASRTVIIVSEIAPSVAACVSGAMGSAARRRALR